MDIHLRAVKGGGIDVTPKTKKAVRVLRDGITTEITVIKIDTPIRMSAESVFGLTRDNQYGGRTLSYDNSQNG